MRNRNHHVTQSMHPMMSVDFDQNDGLVSISAPDPEKRIYDYIFIQFESERNPEQLLRIRISHCKAHACRSVLL